MTDVPQNHVYDHYKGGRYLVLFVADESDERPRRQQDRRLRLADVRQSEVPRSRGIY